MTVSRELSAQIFKPSWRQDYTSFSVDGVKSVIKIYIYLCIVFSNFLIRGALYLYKIIFMEQMNAADGFSGLTGIRQRNIKLTHDWYPDQTT